MVMKNKKFKTGLLLTFLTNYFARNIDLFT